ncbi:regulator of (H+)-ATPase in vacuolar membrane [Orbilia oligospora]|nr:regulator of (H+)-ATPase in vacuolar membrane [Orbilia oligospora]KAF3179168.1 regulator of (H+)-ATPase in vacuolar membrane [Orbilia oligospora]KAF3233063.1 regulator of (H+)-ATPase in vacuolar membrane [Orbilia oligospora]KAF3246781.1 regulator of (H+)-ATPase in vacuolar membrane [Orbilia oligospora]KAF3275128.1 regulator of (H+)-ATPase in vacuolar membrane [Orbilia oligospora]
MRVLPGRVKSDPRSLAAAEWEGDHYIAYVSGKALVISSNTRDLIQTLYHDEHLQVLAFDEGTGKIAVALPSCIHVYSPSTTFSKTAKWESYVRITLENHDGTVHSLSWGANSELLVAAAGLHLWDVRTTDAREIWHKELANPVDLASFSYDATFIASTSTWNRFVKLWRRQAYALGEAEFDFSYLPHPHVVTSLVWKKPFHREIAAENILYTFAADGVFRVWSPLDPHEVYPFQLCTLLDLGSPTYQPALAQPPQADHGFELDAVISLIDTRVFTVATEQAVLHIEQDAESKQQLQNLVDIAKRSSEVLLMFHSSGYLSAWGIENSGSKSKRSVNVFSIVHQVELDWKFATDCGGPRSILTLASQKAAAGLELAVQFSNGEIGWFDVSIEDLLDPTSSICQLKDRISWSGHLEPINHLKRTARGNSLLSSSKEWEHVLWRRTLQDDMPYLERQSLINISGEGRVLKTLILPNGWYVVTLHPDSVCLWDCRNASAVELSRCPIELSAKPFSLILLPEYETLETVYHVFVIDKSLHGTVFAVKIPRLRRRSSISSVRSRPEHSYGTITEHSTFNLPADDDIAMLVPVDPVGWNFTVSDNLDSFNRDVAVSITSKGLVQSWTARMNPNSKEVQWLQTSSLETLLTEPSLIGGSSMHKVAVIDNQKTLLTIWDTRNAQLEHKFGFDEGEYVRDLDWTCTPDSQSILAVGFAHKVILFSQLRYDYLNAGPAWAPFREFNTISVTPHHIGDSIWLSDGALVIGCGNQLFIHPKNIRPEDADDPSVQSLWTPAGHDSRMETIFDLVSRLNGPLPPYHPQFLQQCVLAGKMKLAKQIVVELAYNTKDKDMAQEIESTLGISPEDFHNIDENDLNDDGPRLVNGFSRPDFDQILCSELVSQLKEVSIPYLSRKEQMSLAGIVESMSEEWLHRQSLDEWGVRYLLFFKHYALQKSNFYSRASGVSFREISWAFQSETQEILVDLVTKTYQNKMQWSQARDAGFFMWLKDPTSLKVHFETLARNQYMSKEERDPVDCSLYYLALRKKTVLVGLWRIAHWNKEQGATMKLLSNNFEDPKWKTIAAKNAYALLGKQRFEYAAAFFLLADRPKDAVNVCFTQMNDVQLAIAIARVYDGDEGPVLRELLEEKVLPLAAREGNKWLASWAFWLLDHKDLAVRSLMMPINSLITKTESPGVGKIFLADDPALVILYKLIRDKTLKSLRGAEKIPKGAEFEFVLHCARLYDRMGCDVLALDLVKNWTFLDTSLKTSGLLDVRMKLSKRRSSYIVNDMVHDFKIEDHLPKQPEKSNLVKPPAAAFSEPTMDSFSHFDF